jgi:hypothetical protein
MAMAITGALYERTKPKLDQDEMPGLEARNAERHRQFEVPKKPELSERARELKKKREELVREQERLQAPDVRPGLARELRKHVAIPDREIAEVKRG